MVDGSIFFRSTYRDRNHYPTRTVNVSTDPTLVLPCHAALSLNCLTDILQVSRSGPFVTRLSTGQGT
jgi:hypothetical protein